MSLEEFLDFRKYITVPFMKIIYVVVAIIITIVALLLLVSGSATSSYYYGSSLGPVNAIAGILLLTLGNLFWRLMCESIVIVFSIHDRLVSIDNKLGSASKSTPPQSQGPQTKICTNCGTKFSSGTKFCPNCGTAVSQ